MLEDFDHTRFGMEYIYRIKTKNNPECKITLYPREVV